jgi:periplasmic divalent cation tolerance protein
VTDKVIVYTTCADALDAERVARQLVESRLAACVNVIPSVVSYYRWKGKVETSGEALLMIKTARSLVESVRAAIEKVHSYELPELLAVPIVDGSANYLAWLENEIDAPKETDGGG